MFFQENVNCWKVTPARNVAFLIDGENYFRAVAEACEAARQAIYIIGWDIDSRIRLCRDEPSNDERLGAFVDRLAHQNPDLHIHILEWDFAMLYSLERETLPLLSFGWKTHERVHFALDDNHPVGASHHQRIVVVDDQIAFVGGFDLASCRWDTAKHAPHHPERCDDGKSYGPFHDVQMMVGGQTASFLGDLARRRWEDATGEHIPTPKVEGQVPWPAWIPCDLDDTTVAILRTQPEHDNRSEVREIEQFYLEAIARAQSCIYIENQYLTSHIIGAALEKALSKPEGPEILMVLPLKCSGWLEQQTMGTLRQRLIEKLQKADRYQKLKICYPHREGLESEIINVHSKVLIIDDTLLTIGSANLSNRSMGFDTECNLALAAEDKTSTSDAIVTLRNRLLAEHLGTDPKSIADRFKETGSLFLTVDKEKRDERSLRELPPATHPFSETDLSAREIIDPERPIAIELLLDYLGMSSNREPETGAIRKKLWRLVAVIVTLLIFAGLWKWSPLKQWLSMEHLMAAAADIRKSPLSTPITLAIYVVGSCFMVPITLLILATVLGFGPYKGFVLALSGSLLGGLVSYLLGRWLGRDVVRNLAGKKLNRLSRKLAQRGWLTVAVVRLLPIAPYTIVNMVAGATHISTRSFLLGPAVGMIPGILTLTLFGGGLEKALRQPDWQNVTLAALALGLVLLILIVGRRWLTRRVENHAT